MSDTNLTHKASMVMGYRMRLLIISLMLLLFASWCAYDGFYAYPLQQEQYNAYQDLAAATPGRNPDVQWRELAESKDWPIETPKEIKPMDIYTQFIMGGLLLPPGMFLLVVFFMTAGKWYGVDDQALIHSSGKRAPWDKIAEVDMSRWRTKGIAIVYFNNEADERNKITLDDWKYERDETIEILKVVQEHTGLGKIEEIEEIETNEDSEPAAADNDDTTPPDTTPPSN